MAKKTGYRYYTPRSLPVRSVPIHGANPTVKNVTTEFKRIRVRGDYLAAWDNRMIPWPRYTANVDNELGKNNHLQGIQRLRKGQYIVISGGDPHKPTASHLFVIKMGSRRAEGAWGSNVIHGHVTPATPSAKPADGVVRVIRVDGKMWHAGGLSASGDILAVPIYSTSPDHARIVFYHFADPEKPTRFKHSIERPGVKAGAVALTQLKNGHYLCAAWSDSDVKPARLDFYLSKSADFFDGFDPEPVSWLRGEVKAGSGQDRNFSNFQTVNFINQADGKLFLVGLHNTSEAAPTVPGRDYADLYSVVFPATVVRGSSPKLAKPVIKKLQKKQFFCNDQQSNMDAAAGVYVDRSGQLTVYSSYHWRSDNVIRFNEYRRNGHASDPIITQKRDAWIDLYEHSRFHGRRLSLLGPKDAKIRHYGKISVQGSTFENLVSSVRYQLPKGVKYRLFEGRRYTKKYVDLRGTGRVEQISNLKRRRFGDKVSSSTYV